MRISRRRFSQGIAAVGLQLAAPLFPQPAVARPSYRGPNVIMVRFGGGVRRRETIEAATSYAPYLLNELVPRGVLVPDLSIANLDGVDTSHEEGTLNLLTGRYHAYRDAGSRILVPHLEPTEPTLFELLRKAYDVAPSEALLINGEDRPQEEFFAYGTHPSFGVAFRSEVLSLFRFKLMKLQWLLDEKSGSEDELLATANELEKLKRSDWRGSGRTEDPAVVRFWQRWRQRYGDSGFVNPRGDRLLTELAVTAMTELSPKLMMVCYQDPDYVHWGNASHYTRAIAVIDDGLKRLVAASEALPAYRDNTVFVIVPDCGRDANPLMDVPFQHHFNSRAAHEIFAVLFGTGIAKGRQIRSAKDQTAIAPTVATLMGLTASSAEGDSLREALT